MRTFCHGVTFAAVASLTACSTQPARGPAGPKAPLYDNLGSYHFPVTTPSPEVHSPHVPAAEVQSPEVPSPGLQPGPGFPPPPDKPDTTHR